jgi:hypothetical protein
MPAWPEYAVLVFRDQKMTDAEQLGFTLHFQDWKVG